MQKREDFMNFCLQSPQSDRFCGKIQGIDKKLPAAAKTAICPAWDFFIFPGWAAWMEQNMSYDTMYSIVTARMVK